MVDRVLSGMAEAATADLARAERLIDQSLAASPRYAFAHFVKGEVLRAQKRWERAILEFEAALALDHNLVAALTNVGWCKLSAGLMEEVIPLVEQAIRLSPRDPQIAVIWYRIGQVHLLQSHLDNAISGFEKARSANPELT